MKIKFGILIIILLLVSSFALVTSTKFVSAVPPPPSLAIICDINVSYIENNLCTEENCYPKVQKEFINNQTIYSINNNEIYIDPEKNELVLWNNAGLAYILFTNYTLLEFIKGACESNITPVIEYINQEKSFSGEVWIYPYYPKDVEEKYIHQIDETWYSVIYPNSYYSYPCTFIFDPLVILLFAFAIISAIIAIISFIKFIKIRDKKRKIYLFIFMISVIFAIIFLILSYLAGCVYIAA